jgi:hypothetical protein
MQLSNKAVENRHVTAVSDPEKDTITMLHEVSWLPMQVYIVAFFI